MTTGDPKQAVILALVAISVVGFAIFRLMPRAETSRGMAMAPRDAGEVRGNEKTLQTIVLSNAFWHPKLGEKKVQPQPVIQNPAPRPSGSIAPAKIGGDLLGKLNPVENTGPNQQPMEGPKIGVAAIIGTEERREALLTFGDEVLHKARVGTKFADLTVIAISETAVRVRIGKVERTITVGEEKRL